MFRTARSRDMHSTQERPGAKEADGVGRRQAPKRNADKIFLLVGGRKDWDALTGLRFSLSWPFPSSPSLFRPDFILRWRGRRGNKKAPPVDGWFDR